MKDLIMFENAEIRFDTVDDKEVAADVAGALGYVNMAQAIKQHCKAPKILSDLRPIKTIGLSGLQKSHKRDSI